MAEIPAEMLRNGRPVLPFNDSDEALYRRFEPSMRDGSTIHIDAIELPDMSVNRGSLGPPEWALLVDGTVARKYARPFRDGRASRGLGFSPATSERPSR